MGKMLLFSLLILHPYLLSGQEKISIVCWNVENFFYPSNDTLTEDDEFTPGGQRYWSWYRYYQKINLIWKTVFLLNPESPPDIIALCEIENEQVLNDLFRFSPLDVFSYEIIHQDSPDPRGIDVALIYRKEKLSMNENKFIQLDFEELNDRMTREILHAELVWGNDKLNIFVNHWPSKYGGTGYTDILRLRVAEELIRNIRQISAAGKGENIICCGDFNDVPESRSIQWLIQQSIDSTEQELILVPIHSITGGSLKYQGRWELIDHFFVNKKLFDPENRIHWNSSESIIYCPEHLLIPDEKYGGFMPFRTYTGYKYTGGISDHLPVKLVLEKK